MNVLLQSTELPREKMIEDDLYEYALEDEAEWCSGRAACIIDDLFEVLKDQFWVLNFVPIDSMGFMDVYETLHLDPAGLVSSLQKIYREHVWPDIQRYRKKGYLEAVENELQAH